MVIIAAIGAFFKKIWDWIKQTAWIQPLLIVGLIFGVIFSIKPIVEAVKAGSSAQKAASTFYHNYQLSLEGGENSEADKFTKNLEDIMRGTSTDISSFKDKKGKQIYKFFLMYVAEECPNCEKAKDGFDVLLNKNTDFQSKDYDYNMITIFADQETSETEENKTAFVKYLSRHVSFFEECGGVARDIPYATNKPLNDADLEYLETADPDNFLTPTIFLVELGEERGHGFGIGITEVMFGVEGEKAYEKAQTLYDCWNHEGKFSND